MLCLPSHKLYQFCYTFMMQNTAVFFFFWHLNVSLVFVYMYIMDHYQAPRFFHKHSNLLPLGETILQLWENLTAVHGFCSIDKVPKRIFNNICISTISTLLYWSADGFSKIYLNSFYHFLWLNNISTCWVFEFDLFNFYFYLLFRFTLHLHLTFLSGRFIFISAVPSWLLFYMHQKVVFLGQKCVLYLYYL